MVKMILMTAMTVSLFTSAIILTQSGDNNIAFAKKATTATDTGKTSKVTSSPSTTDTGIKDSGKGTSGSGSGSTSTSSSSGSTSGSGSTSSSTTTDNGNGNSNGNGAVKTNGVTNTARPPGSVVDPNHIFYDRCSAGQHRDPTTHLCVRDVRPGVCGKIIGVSGIAGCCDTRNNGASKAMCPHPPPKPNTCNMSNGGVVSAECHCPVGSKCIPNPNPPTRNNAYMKKYIAGWNQSCSDDMKETLYHKTAPHSKAWSDGYFDARQGDGPCPY